MLKKVMNSRGRRTIACFIVQVWEQWAKDVVDIFHRELSDAVRGDISMYKGLFLSLFLEV